MNDYMQMGKEELIAIILELTSIVKTQAEEIARLKEQINKNSRNSSKPPSSDGYKKPQPKSMRQKSGMKPGAQIGHEGHGFKLAHEVDEIIYHAPSECEACGKALISTQDRVTETRYSEDINIEVRLTAHQTTECVCPDCGHVTRGTFPDNINSTMQYGDTLKSLAVALNTAGTVSINRTHEILQSVFGIPISTGTISAMVRECAAKVEPAMEIIKNKMIHSALVHFDETGTRINKKLHWAHSASTDTLTYITIDEKRGISGMNSSAVLPEFSGIAVHDC